MKLFSFGALMLLSLAIIVLTIFGKLSGVPWLPLTALSVYFVLVFGGYLSLYMDYQNTRRTGSMATDVALAWVSTFVGAIGVCFSFNEPAAWWSEWWSYAAFFIFIFLIISILKSFREIKITDRLLLLLLQKPDGEASPGTLYRQWPLYQAIRIPSKILNIHFPALKEDLDFEDRADGQPLAGKIFPPKITVPGEKIKGGDVDVFAVEQNVRIYGTFPAEVTNVAAFIKRYGNLTNEKDIEKSLETEYFPRILALINRAVRGGEKFNCADGCKPVKNLRDLLDAIPEIQKWIAEQLNKDLGSGLTFKVEEAVLAMPKLPKELQAAWDIRNVKAVEVDSAELTRDASLRKEEADKVIRENTATAEADKLNLIEKGKADAKVVEIKGGAEARVLELNAKAEADIKVRLADAEADKLYLEALADKLGTMGATGVMIASELKEAIKNNPNTVISLGEGTNIYGLMQKAAELFAKKSS